MKKKLMLAAAAAVAVSAAAGSADAALVTFTPAVQSLTFADGVFSHDLSGVRPDGFYGYADGVSAFNGWGQNNEFIQFNGPVTLNSLVIGRCGTCYNSHPTLFTVKLYDASSALLDSQSVSGSSTAETLTFNRAGVSKVQFSFSGTDGTNPFPGDARKVAWYNVGNISYELGAVPEPAAWALMIGGFGLAGGAIRRRRRALAG